MRRVSACKKTACLWHDHNALYKCGCVDGGGCEGRPDYLSLRAGEKMEHKYYATMDGIICKCPKCELVRNITKPIVFDIPLICWECSEQTGLKCEGCQNPRIYSKIQKLQAKLVSLTNRLSIESTKRVKGRRA